MTAGEIRRGIESLKGMCDPRGHDLLDVFQEALIAQVGVVDMVDAAFQMQQTRNWIDGLAGHRVESVGGEVFEVDTHSRKVPPLRSVS